jgi:hypothetical protein
VANLPIAANTTCDIYRSGNSPPAAPDVAGVAIYLTGNYERRMETGEGETVSAWRYTHVAAIPDATDVRDGTTAFFNNAPAFQDTIYVPDKNGTAFIVRWVERKNRGSALAHKRVYLDRKAPTWPTSNL